MMSIILKVMYSNIMVAAIVIASIINLYGFWDLGLLYTKFSKLFIISLILYLLFYLYFKLRNRR